MLLVVFGWDLGDGLFQLVAGASLVSPVYAVMYSLPMSILESDARYVDRFTILGAAIHGVAALGTAIALYMLLGIDDLVMSLVLVVLPVGLQQGLCWQVLLVMRRSAVPSAPREPKW